MTLLQHELTDFKVNAFQNNEFHEVTKDCLLYTSPSPRDTR